ncbi:U3 small nucleolar ribonucleoprotein complex, subunit Mpp10 [Radiomyces spectabilis]|uniref:U3 small nucleolar ribonucleoprotein complex, subunit Mpp10 n=1 Tax=Radiomyces spectabilis TaxID=64574 RepID=UPI00221FD4E4|nr:U3 small nucleolar ribonucleoprotein complex, subunit Mpp10 [Radiomyces spectabilis]KAI8384623.1 U3 small nucleolar ribonucleoprotein complex, subunit Mpp10 [Radiomyces spectabilis]
MLQEQKKKKSVIEEGKKSLPARSCSLYLMVAKSAKQRSPIETFINNVVEKPQIFFVADEKIAHQALGIAKHFYDTAKSHEPMEFAPFPELLTEGFDNDQIWEEIATQNEPFLDYANTILSDFQRQSRQSKVPVTSTDNLEESEPEMTSDHSMLLDDDNDETMFDSSAEYHDDEDEEMALDSANEMEQDDENEEDIEQKDEEDDEEADLDEEEETSSSPVKQSEVDDEFFNLEEFNKWTEEQERLDMMSDREDEEDDEEIDFEADLDEDEEADEEDMADVADITFKDFFVAPTKAKKPSQARTKSVSFKEDEEDAFGSENEEEDAEDDEESEGEDRVRNLFAADDEEGSEDEESKSAHQRRLERIQAQIEQFEEENIGQRHWTMIGETSAKKRPVNSLLEEDLEFDQSVKPVPVITEETTSALEDMIKKRIADNMFDDVERKSDPTLRPWLPSKRVSLDDEKSKKSLAELYEDEYVKQVTGDKTHEKDEALRAEHESIISMFNSLCEKLDALSNFHYTPKAAKPEISIVSNAAAISMEDVTPVNVSDATLLAPEEVYDKKRGEVKSTSEMDQSERKRARQLKKKLKRKDKAMKEQQMKMIEKLNPGLGHKQAKTKAVKELLGQKNVTVIGKDGKATSGDKPITSSALF